MSLSDAQEVQALRQRFGKLTRGMAVYMAFAAITTNAYLFYLVTAGETSPVGIALYAVLELIAYSLIANTAMLAVPKALRVGSPDMPLPKRILAIVVIGGMLVGIAWLGVHGDAEHLRLLRTAPGPLAALTGLNILRPLALTVVLAVFGSIGDWLRWRGSGKPFVNGLALSASPKFLTAIIAPFVALLASDSVHEPPRAALVWCGVYLAIKCGLELLFVFWQQRGMPDRPASRTAENESRGRSAGRVSGTIPDGRGQG